MSILTFDFATAMVISFIIVRFSPYFNVAHYLVQGIEFIVPPKREDVEKYNAEVPKKGKSKKKEAITATPSINVSKIQSGMLVEHYMFPTLDNMINIFMGVTILFVASNLYSCYKPGSSLPLYLIIFACFYVIYALFMPLTLHGLKSYEATLSYMSGASAIILNFFILQNGQHLVGLNLNQDYMVMMENIHYVVNGNQMPFDPSGLQIFPMVFNLSLAILLGVMAGVSFLSVFRFTGFFLKMTTKESNLTVIGILYAAFFSPVFPTLLWFTPFSQFMTEPEYDPTDITTIECRARFTWSFLPIRAQTVDYVLWALLLYTAILKLVVFRKSIREFLWTHTPTLATFSPGNFESFARQVIFVNSYVCVIAVQLLAPIMLSILLSMAYKYRANIDFGLCTGSATESQPIVPHSLVASLIKYVAFSYSWTYFTLSIYCLMLVRRSM